MNYRADRVSLAGIDDFELRSSGKDQPAPITRLAPTGGVEYGPIELNPVLVCGSHARRALAKVSVALI